MLQARFGRVGFSGRLPEVNDWKVPQLLSGIQVEASSALDGDGEQKPFGFEIQRALAFRGQTSYLFLSAFIEHESAPGRASRASMFVAALLALQPRIVTRDQPPPCATDNPPPILGQRLLETGTELLVRLRLVILFELEHMKAKDRLIPPQPQADACKVR